MSNFNRIFGPLNSPVPMSYLDDNFSQLEAASTSTVSITGAGLIGFLPSGIGAVPESLQSHGQWVTYATDFMSDAQRADVRAGTALLDVAAAIQLAINTGKPVFFPAGTYKIATGLTFNTIGQRFFGAAMELTIVSLSGAINGFKYSGSGVIRVFFENMSITGNASTLNGIDFSTSTDLYESAFKNLTIYCGGKAIYAPLEFANQFENVHHSSYGDNGIEIQGGGGTVLTSCYGHTFAAGKYPYRIYNGGTFIRCTGIDAGDYWGLFGQAIAKGDAVNTQYRLTMVGCHYEDFKKNAIQLRYEGEAIIINPEFIPPAVATSATYDCCIYAEANTLGWTIHGGFAASKGAVRNKLAELFSDNAIAPLLLNSSIAATWDDNTTLTTIPNLGTASVAFATYGLNVNNIKMGRGWGFYSPVETTWTANATAFSVTSIDRVKTANTNPTNISQATGGIDGQVLMIHVRDANSTIKHNTGGAGRFMNSGAADIVATNGRPYFYISDGSIWWQV